MSFASPSSLIPIETQLFRMQVRRLLRGRSLGYEDIVDVLTLKNNTAEEREDFVIALHLLARTHVRGPYQAFSGLTRLTGASRTWSQPRA